MENGEVMMKGKDETDEAGYSEKKLDKNVDLQAGQWLDLQQGDPKGKTQNKKQAKDGKGATNDKKKVTNTPPQSPTASPQAQQQQIKKRDEKIVQAIDGVGLELQSQVDEYLKFVIDDINQAEETLRTIIELQTVQKSLLQALKWEAKGSLDVSKLPKQVQNLLK